MGKSSLKKVIQNSDDDCDSDSSLEDLTAILSARIPKVQARQAQECKTVSLGLGTPSSSTRSRVKSLSEYIKPTDTKSKYKYDLKSLAKSTKNYDATEASSNRVKEMLESQESIENEILASNEPGFNFEGFDQNSLLESVQIYEDGRKQEAHKIKNAIERTEAGSEQKQWYFFGPKPRLTPSKNPFPIEFLSDEWKREMASSKMRKLAFISGFVEDMVTLGRALPDEIFLWLVKEACWQECDVLRNCYLNILVQSPDQIQRLLSPVTIKNLFLQLNGTLGGTTITRKIQPVEKIPEYYSNHDWSMLISFLNFLSRIANNLAQKSITQLTCILLRMCVDNVVIENVNILDSMIKTVNSLCEATSFVGWQQFCEEVCENLVYSIEQPTLRLQVVECVPSVTTRCHDLKRRLSGCFVFEDVCFAKKNPRDQISIKMFKDRLKAKDFEANYSTDYRDLRAIVMLMDIVVDDGQSNQDQITDNLMEESFNNDVDEFNMSVRKILNGIGTPGNGFMSKIQAKEAVETFSQRITHTMRTKPKPVHEWFLDRGKERDDMEGEKRGMESFVAKMRGCRNVS